MGVYGAMVRRWGRMKSAPRAGAEVTDTTGGAPGWEAALASGRDRLRRPAVHLRAASTR
jgi:hypothetical protein